MEENPWIRRKNSLGRRQVPHPYNPMWKGNDAAKINKNIDYSLESCDKRKNESFRTYYERAVMTPDR